MIVNIPITLIVSMTAALLGGIISKYYSDKRAQGLFPVFIYNAIGMFVAAIVFLLWGGLGEISSFTVWLGLLFGLISILQSVCTLNALRIGPMSYTNVIINFSTVITALSGVLFFNENFTWLQGIGVALMMGSLVCSVEKKTDENKASLRWFILSIMALFLCGGVGIMQKIHQTSEFKGELNAFLIVAFLFSCVLSFLLSFYFKSKEKTPFIQAFGAIEKTRNYKNAYTMVALIAFSGICGAANNKLNLYLSGAMDSAVFFPIVNGGGLALSILAALIIFKEKLTKKQWVGIALGVLSILCLVIKI